MTHDKPRVIATTPARADSGYALLVRSGVVLIWLSTGCSLYFGHASPDGTQPDAAAAVTPDAGMVPSHDAPNDAAAPDLAACADAFASSRWIVFDSDRDAFNRDIYQMRPDGTELQRLTTDISIDKDPAPSPDGSKLAFASNRTGVFQIHLLDLTTKAVTQLTQHAGGAEEPSFSRDGTLVAFRSGSSLYTIHADGTNEAFVADSGLGTFNAYFSPAFSADGTELFFDRNNELDAVHLDGTGFRYIVNNWTTRIKAPSVSPAGTAVAYETNCGVEGDSVWITPSQVATDPCAGHRVTPPDPMQSHRPAWGPDDFIAYERVNSSNASAIALIGTTPGSSPCLISTDPYDNRNPAWLVSP